MFAGEQHSFIRDLNSLLATPLPSDAIETVGVLADVARGRGGPFDSLFIRYAPGVAETLLEGPFTSEGADVAAALLKESVELVKDAQEESLVAEVWSKGMRVSRRFSASGGGAVRAYDTLRRLHPLMRQNVAFEADWFQSGLALLPRLADEGGDRALPLCRNLLDLAGKDPARLGDVGETLHAVCPLLLRSSPETALDVILLAEPHLRTAGLGTVSDTLLEVALEAVHHLPYVPTSKMRALVKSVARGDTPPERLSHLTIATLYVARTMMDPDAAGSSGLLDDMINKLPYESDGPRAALISVKMEAIPFLLRQQGSASTTAGTALIALQPEKGRSLIPSALWTPAVATAFVTGGLKALPHFAQAAAHGLGETLKNGLDFLKILGSADALKGQSAAAYISEALRVLAPTEAAHKGLSSALLDEVARIVEENPGLRSCFMINGVETLANVRLSVETGARVAKMVLAQALPPDKDPGHLFSDTVCKDLQGISARNRVAFPLLLEGMACVAHGGTDRGATFVRKGVELLPQLVAQPGEAHLLLHHLEEVARPHPFLSSLLARRCLRIAKAVWQRHPALAAPLLQTAGNCVSDPSVFRKGIVLLNGVKASSSQPLAEAGLGIAAYLAHSPHCAPEHLPLLTRVALSLAPKASVACAATAGDLLLQLAHLNPPGHPRLRDVARLALLAAHTLACSDEARALQAVERIAPTWNRAFPEGASGNHIHGGSSLIFAREQDGRRTAVIFGRERDGSDARVVSCNGKGGSLTDVHRRLTLYPGRTGDHPSIPPVVHQAIQMREQAVGMALHL